MLKSYYTLLLNDLDKLPPGNEPHGERWSVLRSIIRQNIEEFIHEAWKLHVAGEPDFMGELYKLSHKVAPD